MSSNSNRIGVFDSGVGGLTVLRGLVQELPQYDYCYLADTANLPYGERSQDELFMFTTQAAEFFFAHGCSLVILACNTVSSQALHTFQQSILPRYPGKKVLGVLVPLAEAATDATKNRRVGVLATQSTVDSGAFEREIQKLDSSVEIFQQACPILVPLIENGKEESAEIDVALDEYLQKLLVENVDAIILGCTHYSILEEKIRSRVGNSVALVSAAHVVPAKLEAYLQRHHDLAIELSRGKFGGACEYFVTSDAARFDTIGSRVFGTPIVSQNIEIYQI